MRLMQKKNQQQQQPSTTTMDEMQKKTVIRLLFSRRVGFQQMQKEAKIWIASLDLEPSI